MSVSGSVFIKLPSKTAEKALTALFKMPVFIIVGFALYHKRLFIRNKKENAQLFKTNERDRCGF